MSKIVVDQIQKSGGAAFSLPLTDGTAGQLVKTDGSGNLSFISPVDTDTVVPADSAQIYGSVFTASARGNIYSTGEWTSSGPNSTYQNATAAGSNATYTHMSFNMFLGDGYPGGTSQPMYAGDFRGLENRTILYSGNDRLGHNNRELFYYENNTSYMGVSWHVMPVRNTTGSAITRTLNFMYSAYDTYNGAALGYFTPDGATYAATTGGTWTQPFTSTSNTITSSSASITIPAGKTVLIMLVTSHNYQTTYYFKESSMFYGLSSFFGTGLVCDLRMLNALALLRTPSATNTTSNPEQIYTGCAAVYGNR
jgi:hypothetical protein